MTKKQTFLAWLAVFFILFGVFYEVKANEDFELDIDSENFFVVEGRNFVNFSYSMYVVDFIRLNPAVDSISYFDVSLNKTVGFINIFDGVGKNFFIVEGKEYEVFAKSNTTLIVGR